ncbi:MAG TPA: biotin-dependent carboxyltransferase family protein [Bacillaceae bacterium]|nr:biotin-dependent carboxyltransferase family protein [Bacillaceae bacterium]
MVSIEIIKPGVLSTIQDLGRIGNQQFGVIKSGAMDEFALRTANILVGNEENEAAIEMTLIGPTIRFNCNTLVAICGGDFSPTIDGELVPKWRPVFIKKGTTLKMGGARKQIRAYLAVAGGLNIPVVMGSRSTYLRAGIGGFMGRKLLSGDVIEIINPIQKAIDIDQSYISFPKFISSQIKPQYESSNVIRIVRGSEYHLFSKKSKELLLSKPFILSSDSDRMGYRLDGHRIQLHKEEEMVSSSVTFGTIQVPANGSPIILMADHQTTGGYPKIGQVIAVDLPLLAQMNIGSEIYFQEVSFEEAERLFIERERDIQILKHVMRKELINFLGELSYELYRY